MEITGQPLKSVAKLKPPTAAPPKKPKVKLVDLENIPEPKRKQADEVVADNPWTNDGQA